MNGATRRSTYELDNLLKLGGTKLRRDVIDAALREQQNGSIFRYEMHQEESVLGQSLGLHDDGRQP